MKIQFVLVDFENVQSKDVSLLSGAPYKIKIFVGANQSKIPLETASALQTYGPDAEYVQVHGSGKNALDFHIAYYIGRLAAEMPKASFHVISKDTGFDPLIKHLRAQKIDCQRSKSIADIFLVETLASGSVVEKVDAIINNLVRRKAAKPRTLKTLRSTIKALFANQLADGELDRLIEQLKDRGTISNVEGKLHYELNPST